MLCVDLSAGVWLRIVSTLCQFAVTGDHAPGEAVDIPSIARQATRAAILMSRLSAEKR